MLSLDIQFEIHGAGPGGGYPQLLCMLSVHSDIEVFVRVLHIAR